MTRPSASLIKRRRWYRLIASHSARCKEVQERRTTHSTRESKIGGLHTPADGSRFSPSTAVILLRVYSAPMPAVRLPHSVKRGLLHPAESCRRPRSVGLGGGGGGGVRGSSARRRCSAVEFWRSVKRRRRAQTSRRYSGQRGSCPEGRRSSLHACRAVHSPHCPESLLPKENERVKTRGQHSVSPSSSTQKSAAPR